MYEPCGFPPSANTATAIALSIPRSGNATGDSDAARNTEKPVPCFALYCEKIIAVAVWLCGKPLLYHDDTVEIILGDGEIQRWNKRERTNRVVFIFSHPTS